MQHVTSFGLVAGIIAAVALLIALAAAGWAAIVAVALAVLGFGAFLVWRGRRRADVTLSDRHHNRVPSTSDASADPVRDSSIPEATASGTAGRHRADAPGV
jgi:hypothetical protein